MDTFRSINMQGSKSNSRTVLTFPCTKSFGSRWLLLLLNLKHEADFFLYSLPSQSVTFTLFWFIFSIWDVLQTSKLFVKNFTRPILFQTVIEMLFSNINWVDNTKLRFVTFQKLALRQSDRRRANAQTSARKLFTVVNSPIYTAPQFLSILTPFIHVSTKWSDHPCKSNDIYWLILFSSFILSPIFAVMYWYFTEELLISKAHSRVEELMRQLSMSTQSCTLSSL